jgi:hypothetical protein
MFESMLVWDELPNSGELLKLIIPNQGRKALSGWINCSGMVTSYKMSENEMDYRGSKSGIIPVKEQRVDGSYLGALYIKTKVKIYSNGFRKKLSNQDPF